MPIDRAVLSRALTGKVLLLGFILCAVTIAAYQPAWNAGFIWDDDLYVSHNRLLSAPDGLKRIWFSLESPSQYFPLTYTFLRMEWQLWGAAPAGYHWVNLLVHTINALLVWRLLARLSVPGAWLGAAFFALHPVNVESVAWIAEQKNVLMCLFFLLGLLAWTEFVEAGKERAGRLYILALIFYALALFSKTTACTMPAALLLVLWLKKQPINRARWLQIAPFVVLGIGMGLVTMWWERFHQGTGGKLFALGPLDRVLVASRAIWFYPWKLFWPANLTFSYSRWSIHAADPLAYGWLLAGLAACAAAWFSRRLIPRGVQAGLLFYVATLSPLLGFIMLFTFRYSFVADHYQYVASIGPLALVAAGMTLGLRSVQRSNPWAWPAAGASLLTLLAILTFRQSGTYADLETLWRATLARNPDSLLANGNFGAILWDKGDVDGAWVYYEKALELEPDSGEAHYNVGNCLLKKKRIEEAIVQYETALKDMPSLPAHNNLGSAYLRSGRPEKAIDHFQKAIEFDPNDAEPRSNLGVVLSQKGRLDEAIVQFKRAVELRPGDKSIRKNFGVALLRLGHVDEAITQFHTALAIQPSATDAEFDLASAYLQRGSFAEAAGSLERVLEAQPGNGPAHNLLGKILLQSGHVKEAVGHFERALEVGPDNGEVLNNLAWILATSPDAALRDGGRAVSLAERADRISQGNPSILSTLAAAYAEAGRFDNAIVTAKRVLEIMSPQKDGALFADLRKRMETYERRSPFRDVRVVNGVSQKAD